MSSPFDNLPEVQQKDNWVSFSFASEPGYGKIATTVHGAPAFVAEAFAVSEFDGKISTLMKRAIEIDGFFKRQYGAGEGKA